jgi:hypothetical protein
MYQSIKTFMPYFIQVNIEKYVYEMYEKGIIDF